jgi:hypothetical protein
MKIAICLEKEDIVTDMNGLNYRINLPNDIQIIITPDAIKELYKDVRDYERQAKKKKK